jgi:osmoprotectant transport system permease protein
MRLITFWIEHRAELGGMLQQHILLVGVSTSVAILLGIPAGIAAAHPPRLGRPLIGAANIAQTIPSLALLGFLIPLPFIGGVGPRAAIVALILYALLPIVRTTAAGLRSIDRAILESAVAMGMTPRQVLTMVELPLALPSIVAGVRVATVIGVGTATIAAFIGAGGLGEFIFRGLSMVDGTMILAGAVPAAALALIADAVLTQVERRLSPGRRVGTSGGRILVIAGAALALGMAATLLSAPSRETVIDRFEEFHRAGHPGRAARADAGARDGPPRRSQAEPRWDVHLRPGDARRRDRRVRGVHRDRADGDLPTAGRARSRRRVRDHPRAVCRSGDRSARSARVQQHVCDAGQAPGRRGQRPADDRRSAPRGGPMAAGLRI